MTSVEDKELACNEEFTFNCIKPETDLKDLDKIELKFKKNYNAIHYKNNKYEYAMLTECTFNDKDSFHVKTKWTRDAKGYYKESYDKNWFDFKIIIIRNMINSKIKYCLINYIDYYHPKYDYKVQWLSDLMEKLSRSYSITKYRNDPDMGDYTEELNEPIMNQNLDDWNFELLEEKETVTITYTRKNRIAELLSSRLGGKRRRKTAKKQRKSRKSRKNRTMKFW